MCYLFIYGNSMNVFQNIVWKIKKSPLTPIAKNNFFPVYV